MPDAYKDLRAKLEEMFQLDHAELDFGIYRIMNSKRDEIKRFLDYDLLPQVKAALAQYQSTDKAQLRAQLEQAIAQAQSLGADPESLPKVQELRQKLAVSVDAAGLENEVYSHLYNFFRRYYQDGDFLSLRRYKEGTYAIPYEGQEVKMYWANHDQYYVKTTEYFWNYTFTLPSGKRVHFKLVEADTEKDNAKPANGNERRFILDMDNPVDVENDELTVRFEYKPDGGRRSQADLNDVAARTIRDHHLLAEWLMELATTQGDGRRTLLEKHLTDYTARNTFDYFIHRNLSQFLRRELDFYIENEVMHLDDVSDANHDTTARLEQNLSKIKIIRSIAQKIIRFMAQLEDFQKRLWLKKKFVVEVNYCITLDRVPEDLYSDIAANDAQREEWVRLFAIDEIGGDLASHAYSVPVTLDFLKDNRHLLLDTRFFDEAFKTRLMASIQDLDEQCDGLLIHAENFHALGLLQEKYREQIKSVYIDPPYNTDAGPISYKNGYRHSSWLSLVGNRLEQTRRLLRDDAITCVTIDDNESHRLRFLFDSIYPEAVQLGTACIKNNPAGRTGTVGFSVCHEYAFFYGHAEGTEVNRLEHSEEQKARYAERDEISFFEWTNFRKHGGLNTYRTTRPRQYYPIYVKGTEIRIPNMTWDDGVREYVNVDPPQSDEEVLLPIDSKGRERIWDFVVTTARDNIPHFMVKKDALGSTAIYRKWRINSEGLLPQTWWDKSEYSAVEYGTNLLAHLFGRTHTFMFPKSIHAVSDALKVSGLRNELDGLALDYYGGSGTTAHAVIGLNRTDGGTRKYILVEAENYFHTVLKPRVLKVAYSPDWKEGKPSIRSSGISHCVKYMRLESYEDTLNNLEFRRTDLQQSLLDSKQEFREGYMLSYILDVESRDSASLLSLDRFEDPFNYVLNIATGTVGETKPTKVDLVETFNYLIGLTVRHIDRIRGYCVVQGTSPKGERVLIIWRNTKEKSNEDLNEFFRKQEYNPRDMEFDLIYVNGDNNLENIRREDETWKVRLIEEDFKRLMFDVDEV
jgi:adenine-specific DNA-methyltransferase